MRNTKTHTFVKLPPTMSGIIGVRYIKLIYMEEKRAVLDVMLHSGYRVTADVHHGESLTNEVRNCISEITSGERDRAQHDADLSQIVKWALPEIAENNQIDLTMEPKNGLTKRMFVLFLKHIKSTRQSQGIRFESVQEGIVRYFLPPGKQYRDS